MNYGIEIIHKKGLCTIQDLGRENAQHLGFSGSGVSDEYSFLSANQLLNNDSNSPALEITLGQISFKSLCQCTFAITGADCAATINEQPIQNGCSYQLNIGDVLTLNQAKSGLHSYLAFLGGVNSKTFMKSSAQTINEQKLGLFSEPLTLGSVIELTEQCFNADSQENIKNLSLTSIHKEANFHASEQLTLRFMPSPLWQTLSAKKRHFFLSQSYEILPQSNRMGYRLSSDVLFCTNPSVANKTSNLSKAVTFGTIQLPENGQPIILMKERQTIGGYPVLGTVMKTDLFRLSQKRPGEHIRFSLIGVEQAQQQLAAFYQKFNR